MAVHATGHPDFVPSRGRARRWRWSSPGVRRARDQDVGDPGAPGWTSRGWPWAAAEGAAEPQQRVGALTGLGRGVPGHARPGRLMTDRPSAPEWSSKGRRWRRRHELDVPGLALEVAALETEQQPRRSRARPTRRRSAMPAPLPSDMAPSPGRPGCGPLVDRAPRRRVLPEPGARAGRGSGGQSVQHKPGSRDHPLGGPRWPYRESYRSCLERGGLGVLESGRRRFPRSAPAREDQPSPPAGELGGAGQQVTRLA